MRKILASLLAALVLASCSAGGGEPPGALDAPAHTEAAISQHLGLNRWGEVRMAGVQCSAAAVLTTPTMIAMYADAGDDVATNPDQTAGVKVIGPAPCHQLFTQALADLK